MYFDVFKSKRVPKPAQPYWWVAKGENHETMCTSEMLSTKADCVSSIRTIIREASAARVFDETGEVTGTVEQRRIRV